MLPLGKPNAPLLDLGSLSTVIIPAMRFLLSLPFAHLVVAIKNYFAPYLELPQPSKVEETSTSDESSFDSMAYARRIPSDRVPPPSSRSTSASSTRGSNTGSRGGGAGIRSGDRVLSARGLTNTAPTHSVLTSYAPKQASVANDAYTILQSLPAAPQSILSVSGRSKTDEVDTASEAKTNIRPFAFIPPTTPPRKVMTSAHGLHNGLTSMGAATPMMPGFLTSRDIKTASEQEASTSKDGQGSNTEIVGLDKIKEVPSAKKDSVNVATAKSRQTSAIRRKRTSDDEDEPSPRKTRASPTSRRKGNAISQSSTMTELKPKADARMKKSISSTTTSLSEASQGSEKAIRKPRARKRTPIK